MADKHSNPDSYIRKHSILGDFDAVDQLVCLVCQKKYDSGEILPHKQLRSIPADNLVYGIGLCPEHQKMKDDGYVALIGTDPAKSRFNDDGSLDHGNAYRSGNIIHVDQRIWENLFNVPLPPNGVCYVDDAVIENLKQIQEDQARDEEKAPNATTASGYEFDDDDDEDDN